jgi:putative thiamine transport system permease protein
MSIGRRLLSLAPALTLAAFVLPIAAGLAGTLLPAFGWLPALGGHAFSLAPWRELLATPGVTTAFWLTLFTGWLSTLLALGLAVAVAAHAHGRTWAQSLGRWIAPVLAVPHSALAIGLAFVILPSGWLVRWISPGLSGWQTPPDVSTVGHASGWALVLALVIKELPYLLLMILGALNQVAAGPQVRAAQALGYRPSHAWLAVALPQVLRQIRLPVCAVLAYSLSVVDVALILGPGHPPTLAVLAVRWFADPDTRWVFPGSALAFGLLVLVLLSLALLLAAERVLLVALRAWAQRGQRRSLAPALARTGWAVALALVATAGLALLAMGLWSVATQWRWPDAWPSAFALATWQRQTAAVAGPAATSLALAVAATGIALVLSLACLELETLRGRRASAHRGAVRGWWLLYLPLLVPQVAFLFGLQVLLVRIGVDGWFWAVVWSHLVFVLPYLFLSLADPWRAFDERYTRSALALGASRWRIFWRVKLPILFKPVALAAAVAVGVSVGLYLPTLLVGAGRVASLTTEAVTLAGGADRRVIGVWAVLQATLPLAAYALALLLPPLVGRWRMGRS